MGVVQISRVSETDALHALNKGALLLAGNAQLAAEWKRRLVAASGSKVCATPHVSAWQQWLTTLTRDLEDIPVALGELQELLLWERVIRADSATGADASVRGLARHASAVWSLMREYGIETDELAGYGEEADALARWAAGMQRELATMQRTLLSDVSALLLPHIGGLVHEQRIVLDGFFEFTPMQRAILQALADNGVCIEILSPEKASLQPGLTACSDAEAEYRHVARCIAELLASQPLVRIGVAISRQVRDTSTLRRILDATLMPEASLADGRQSVLMAGEPLAAMPLVCQMTRLLQLAGKSGAPYADFSPLLFSPGLKGFGAEREARAALDAKLRDNKRHYISFKSLLASDALRDTPQLAAVLKAMLLWNAAPRPAGEWVDAVHGLLQSAGYLRAEGEGEDASLSRSNAEIRQLNAFRESLATLVAADAVSPPMDWGGFLSLLSIACNAMQLAAPAIYPQVQVLPLERMTGLHFDAVFILGLDEEALPIPAQPVPLLPFAVQRRHALPGVTAAAAYAESGFLWQQLMQAAPRVHISFARSREGKELKPSPLLGGVDAFGTLSCEAKTAPAPRIDIETYEDAPDVPLLEGEQVRGGAAIVKNQSACPFRAFATHRLGIAALETPEPGIDAAAKGSLIHLALEYIWSRLASQAALLELDEAGMASLIEAAIAHACERLRHPLPDAVRQFECERMRRVLTEWLSVERERPSFRVQHCEKPFHLELPEGGSVRFPVNLKADRIDLDAQGHKILIDYKTGRKQSIGQWTGERMAEPQLPLYSMAANLGEEDAVCFASVRSGEMGFEGLSGVSTGIKGIAEYKGKDEAAEDWPALLAVWRERINALAGEFIAGRSQVMPLKESVCNFCRLEAVCRIDEIGFATEDDEDAGEGV